MSTASGNFMSQTSGNSGFFSTIQGIFGNLGNIVGQAGELYSNASTLASGNVPTWAAGGGYSPQGIRQEPTYSAPSGSTTATSQAAPNYLPYILGGVGLLAALFLLKD